MVYPINNLREAVETAKHMLTKEQIDKQTSGQSSASPYMKVNHQNSKKNGKSISFCAIETIQKQGDSIDKLTSLMNKLNSKLDRKEIQPNTNQEFAREEIEDADKDRIDIILEADLIVENEVHMTVAEVGEAIKMALIIVIKAIDPEMGDLGQITDIMTDPITEGKNLTKIMAKEIEIEV